MGTGASCAPTMSWDQNAHSAKLVIGGCQRMVVKVINPYVRSPERSLVVPFVCAIAEQFTIKFAIRI